MSAHTTELAPSGTPPTGTPPAPRRLGYLAVAVALVAFVIAQQWGEALLREGVGLFLKAPPFMAEWRVLWSPGLWWALAAAIVVVLWWVPLTERLAWGPLLVGVGAWALLWPVLLQGSEGWDSLYTVLGNRRAYLPTAQAIDSPAEFLRTFVQTLPDYPTHVKGHPPGATLAHWAVDRLGGGRSDVLTATFLVTAASAAPAALVALARVADRDTARRAAPFVGLAPAVIWIASSPDAMFMGVIAWAVALGAIAITSPRRVGLLAGLGSGVLAGLALSFSYGSMLLLGPLWALAVLAVLRRNWQPLVAAAAGFSVIPLLFVAAGFNWLDGLEATRTAYNAGVAPGRPARYFLLSNLVVLSVAVGPAAIAAVARLRDRRVWWLVGGAVFAVLSANVSLMSKGEVERIWLPAVPFLVLATVVFTTRAERRGWVGVQLGLAILLQVVVDSPW